MYWLWVSTELEPTERLRERLAIRDSRYDERARVWLSRADPEEGLGPLADALNSGEVRSAALAGDRLLGEFPWITVEWFGALVVQTVLLPLLGAVRQQWTADVRSPTFERDQAGSGGWAVLRPLPSVTDHDPHVVDTAYEFANSLDGDRPVQVRTTLAAVQRNRRAWFGEFADPDVGGANALLALSGATSSSTSIVLRNPAALGMSVATGTDALSTLARAGRIRVQRCYGFQRHRTPVEHVPREAASMMHGPGDYAVYAELTAVVDPDVEIDTGVVFEQTTLNDVQTLAAAESRRVTVNPGMLVPVAVTAWCLNATLRPPNGEPMNVTPFRYATNSTDQSAIWAERDALFDGP